MRQTLCQLRYRFSLRVMKVHLSLLIRRGHVPHLFWRPSWRALKTFMGGKLERVFFNACRILRAQSADPSPDGAPLTSSCLGQLMAPSLIPKKAKGIMIWESHLILQVMKSETVTPAQDAPFESSCSLRYLWNGGEPMAVQHRLQVIRSDQTFHAFYLYCWWYWRMAGLQCHWGDFT